MCWIATYLDARSFSSAGLEGKGTSCRGLCCLRIVTASKLICLHELNGFDAAIKATATVTIGLQYLGCILAIEHANGVGDGILVEVIRMTAAAATAIARRI